MALLPGRVCRPVNAEQAQASERAGHSLLGFLLHDMELPSGGPLPPGSLTMRKIQEAGTSGRSWAYNADTVSKNGNSGQKLTGS
jgi:hypothetical protein